MFFFLFYYYYLLHCNGTKLGKG